MGHGSGSLNICFKGQCKLWLKNCVLEPDYQGKKVDSVPFQLCDFAQCPSSVFAPVCPSMKWNRILSPASQDSLRIQWIDKCKALTVSPAAPWASTKTITIIICLFNFYEMPFYIYTDSTDNHCRLAKNHVLVQTLSMVQWFRQTGSF